jgi:hypothetical protein
MYDLIIKHSNGYEQWATVVRSHSQATEVFKELQAIDSTIISYYLEAND